MNVPPTPVKVALVKSKLPSSTKPLVILCVPPFMVKTDGLTTSINPPRVEVAFNTTFPLPMKTSALASLLNTPLIIKSAVVP